MDFKEEMRNDGESVFALLVFGQLGKSGQISYESILSVHSNTICISGDQSGINWIRKNTPKHRLRDICEHYIPIEMLEKLGLEEGREFCYSRFGEERFIKLTTFKWFLLEDIMRLHSERKQVIFSDLDVIWLNGKLRNPISFKDEDSCLTLLQDDTPKNTFFPHFCTGIMYWSVCDQNKLILRNLFETQFTNNISGFFIPDEPTFNNFWRNLENKSMFRILDPAYFVIGHRFFKLVFSRKLYLSKVEAFHANYVVGEHLKYRRLRIVKLRQNGNPLWILLIVRELFSMVISKLSSSCALLEKPKKQ
jgi:hypothetical protein